MVDEEIFHCVFEMGFFVIFIASVSPQKIETTEISQSFSIYLPLKTLLSILSTVKPRLKLSERESKQNTFLKISPFAHAQFPIPVDRQHIGAIGRKTIADVFFQSKVAEAMVMRRILFLHKFIQIVFSFIVQRICYL